MWPFPIFYFFAPNGRQLEKKIIIYTMEKFLFSPYFFGLRNLFKRRKKKQLKVGESLGEVGSISF